MDPWFQAVVVKIKFLISSQMTTVVLSASASELIKLTLASDF